MHYCVTHGSSYAVVTEFKFFFPLLLQVLVVLFFDPVLWWPSMVVFKCQLEFMFILVQHHAGVGC